MRKQFSPPSYDKKKNDFEYIEFWFNVKHLTDGNLLFRLLSCTVTVPSPCLKLSRLQKQKTKKHYAIERNTGSVCAPNTRLDGWASRQSFKSDLVRR